MNSVDSITPSPRITLESYVSIFARRKVAFIGVFAAVTAIGLILMARVPRVFEAQGTFRIIRPVAPIDLEASSTNRGVGAASILEDESVESQVEAMRRPEFLQKLYRRSGVERAQPSLKIMGVEGGEIAVTARGASPQALATVVSQAPALSAEDLDARRRQRLRANIQLVEEEAKKADRLVLTAERSLLPYQASDPRAESEASKLAELKSAEEVSARLRESQIQRDTQQVQLGLLRSRLAKEPAELVQTTQSTNPEYTELQSRIASLERERQRLLVTLLPAHEDVKAVEEEIAAARATLGTLPRKVKEEMRVPNGKRLALETRVTETEAAMEATQVEIEAMNRLKSLGDVSKPSLNPAQWETVTARLREEVDSARAVRRQLNTKLRALKTAEGSLRPYEVSWISQPYTPRDPVSPQPQKDLVVTLALAALLAVGVAFLLEYLDDRTYSPDDVERVSPMPALGAVPVMPAKQMSHPLALPIGGAAFESYRLVRSGISFAGLDAPVRSILVTSPGAGEGKTITSVNLATAMALDGKRVILVDADLRRPMVHQVLDLKPSPGLADVVSGACHLEAALLTTQTPNLRVLCAGSPVSDPAELLGSSAFTAIIDQASEKADILIFDSPPCLYVADAAVLSARADGVVLVVRTGHTRLSDITAAESFLNRARARILGVVYNGAGSRDSHRYGYYGVARNGSSHLVMNGAGSVEDHAPLTHSTLRSDN